MAEYSINEQVFYNHKQYSWVLAQISGVSPNQAKPITGKPFSSSLHDIVLADQARKLEGESLRDVPDWDLEHVDLTSVDKTVDDLLNLSSLHEATLLRCLYLRYMSNVIYTNIGAIVVALNPFNTKIPHYQDSCMPSYLAEAGQPVSERLLPHSWAQAHNTFEELRTTRQNQCILISGESGAGKTEATKIVMKYLSKISVLQGSQSEKSAAEGVAANLAACSPILESFGNAKTVRNDNSSRFGKLMRVKFDNAFLLKGAFTTKYLLEKSRIVTCAADERLYHSFYLVCRSASAAATFGLDKPLNAYRSINSGNCLDNKEYNTTEDFEEVSASMKKIGLNDSEVQQVWQAAAAILHMQNAMFVADGEGSKLDSGTLHEFKVATKLWGVDDAKLLEEFSVMKLVINGESTRKLQPKHKAEDSRDALCKSLYDNLFSWLVTCCNKTCDAEGEACWIALLDIFGFEDFKLNSFEQLCINLTNETLQNHYNEYIFKRDMQQCRAEGIDTVDIKCPDNSPCLKLIHTALKLLDDQCAVGTGTSGKFLDSLLSSCGSHEFLLRRPLLKDSFGIRHYAGDVTYNVEGWLEKNRDTLREDIKLLMKASTVPLCSRLFEETSGTKATVGTFFKKQLFELMEVINSTNPHWIRCIKPHPAKKPLMFDGQYTMNQLESSGVLGTVKIRKAGYPVRWTHSKFARHYTPLVPLDSSVQSGKDLEHMDLRQHCGKVLQLAGLDSKQSQIGKTLVFMKAATFPLLEKRRNAALRTHAMLMQRCGRGLKMRRRMMKLSKALLMQRAGRAILARAKLFELYCEKNREKLLALAKAREEERRLAAEREKKLKEERLAFLREEAALRDDLRNALWEEFEELHLVEQREREVARDAVLAAQLAEQRRAEEERRKRLAEEARMEFERRYTLLLPEMDSARHELLMEEDEMFEIIRFAEWKGFRLVETTLLVRSLLAQETRWRCRIVDDWEQLQHAFSERKEELSRKNEIFGLARELRQTVQMNTERRESERRLQRELNKAVPRSYVETVAAESVKTLQLSPGQGHSICSHPLLPVILEKQLSEFSPHRSQQRHREVTSRGMKHSGEATNSPRRKLTTVQVGATILVRNLSSTGTVTEVHTNPPIYRVLLESGESTWVEVDQLEERVAASPLAQPRRDVRFSPGRSPSKSSAALFSTWQQQQALLDETCTL